jgi:CRP-like cAMP-binding protein
MSLQISNKPNNLLSKLRSPEFELIKSHLYEIHLPSEKVIYRQGDDVETVYFPCGSTLVSFVVETENGNAVETMMVGREGAVGGIVSQGRLPAYSQIMVQYGGSFLCMPTKILNDIKKLSPEINSLFARYADCVMAQIFQSAACNASHTVEERAAKWILAAQERVGTNVIVLTHERLGAMLGVGRSYISRVIQQLKSDGILEGARGRLTIINQSKLLKTSCDCNDCVRDHFQIVLAGVYPNSATQTK